MKIYTVYFYYNQWSDSYETDRLYFTSLEKAKEHERKLLEENKEELLADEDFGVLLEEIDVIADSTDFEIEYNEKLSEFVNELIDEIKIANCYIHEEMNPPDYAKALARGHANVLRKRFNKLVEGKEPINKK